MVDAELDGAAADSEDAAAIFFRFVVSECDCDTS